MPGEPLLKFSASSYLVDSIMGISGASSDLPQLTVTPRELELLSGDHPPNPFGASRHAANFRMDAPDGTTSISQNQTDRY